MKIKKNKKGGNNFFPKKPIEPVGVPTPKLKPKKHQILHLRFTEHQ